MIECWFTTAIRIQTWNGMTFKNYWIHFIIIIQRYFFEYYWPVIMINKIVLVFRTSWFWIFFRTSNPMFLSRLKGEWTRAYSIQLGYSEWNLFLFNLNMISQPKKRNKETMYGHWFRSALYVPSEFRIMVLHSLKLCDVIL